MAHLSTLCQVPSNPSIRAERRAASEAAILDAAVVLFAAHGPDGVSLRDVAAAAGVTHALVARYFGSKGRLVAAVEARLAGELRVMTDAVDLPSAEGFRALLRSVRADPALARLLVRSGLGDLDESIVPGIIAERCAAAANADLRRRLCGYAAASLLLGWVSWEGFLVPALHLGRLGRRRRDDAMAAAATAVAHLAPQAAPPLEPRPLTGRVPPEPLTVRASRDAILAAAVELFTEHSPASVSVRDIARHAGVNHGLIHRHFGSKDDLLAEAIEVGTRSLLPGALAPEGFDIDAVVLGAHLNPPALRMIARVLVDDIAIARVRRHYPVLRSLLALVRRLPGEARPPALADPRLAAAAAASLTMGSAMWGAGLRKAFQLDDENRVVSAVADLSHWLLGSPSGAGGVQGTRADAKA
jgi:AcrR family transcriptional regulator